jgi:hypothetical protein
MVIYLSRNGAQNLASVMKSSSENTKAAIENIHPRDWSGTMNESAGKLELAGCIALMLAVYGLFLASVTEPYRPDIAAWIGGGKAPAAPASARADSVRLAVRN